MGTLLPNPGAQATNWGMNSPQRTAVDPAGNLYVSDYNSNVVYKITPSGTISVVAGTGASGWSGDGGPATNAKLYTPVGLTLDSAGNLYIADANNHRIRKVTPGGVISTVAGTGTGGYSGDGGAATSAKLYYPYDMALDGSGNLYIADYQNNRIRKVDTSGIISTVAGTGTASYSGDGGPATGATLNTPCAIAIDGSGNLYLTDLYNHRIRKVDTSGTITTVAGTGTAGYSGDGGTATSTKISFPRDARLDAAGNLYIADSSNQRIRKVDTNGIITTVAGSGTYSFSGDGGAATGAALAGPSGITVDAAGNLYIGDSDNKRLRKVATNGIISTVGGNGALFSGDEGPAANAQISAGGCCFDGAGNLYIADYGNHRVRKVATNGTITTVAGNGTRGFTGDGGSATSASLSAPWGIVLDGAGNVYIADNGNHRVRKVATNGTITTVAGDGTTTFAGDGGSATSASLMNPRGLAMDGAGNLYIADYGHHRVRKVNTAGTITTVAGTGSGSFAGDGGAATSAALSCWNIALDTLGNLYISDRNNNRIRKVGLTGIITTVAGTGTSTFSGDGGPATSAALSNPFGIAVEASGNTLVFVDNSVRVRKVQ